MKEYVAKTESLILILQFGIPLLLFIVGLATLIKCCCSKYKSKCASCSEKVTKILKELVDKILFSSIIRFFLVGYVAMCL